MEIVYGRKLDEYWVDFQFRSNNQLYMQWYSPDGREMKTTPSRLKKTLPEALDKIKKKFAADRKYLSNRKKELDRSFIKNQIWTYPDFQKKLLGHPLKAVLAKKLIWQFRSGKKNFAAFFQENGWLHSNGKVIKNIPEEAEVRLWHPVFAEPDEVRAWREYMNKMEIIQPIKQCYREIYLLTDAEKKTGTYSNRMAAHILKQGQFQALARVRGWKSTTLIFDIEDGSASLKIPIWELQAVLWISRADDEDIVYAKYLVTDQIRFERDGSPMELDLIPKVVFSEVMRDADLFVGVASVGNDPTWQDTGPEEHQTYWSSFSFGELSENAKSRKAALTNLLPRLAIADKCSLHDRFLHVKGELRTYKVHLGSSNILMEPNDQYLCIVPDNRKKEKDTVFLPFEGDRTLSLILSKAFLLARDTEIEDESILSQIKS